MVKKNISKLLFPVLLITLTGCNRLVAPVGEPVLYESSFETSNPLDEWTYKPVLYTDEAAPDGGTQCILVSGGCVIPHATIDLGEVEVTGDYVIEVWGRLLFNGGGIALHRGSLDEEYWLDYRSVSIDSDVWQIFTSEPINLRRGEYASLTMSSGGFIAGGMLVDLLKVYKID